MIIDFHCPFCGKALAASDEISGKKAKCPGCERVITIPQPDEESQEDVDQEKT